jgi:hypothetical protein
MVSRSPVTTQPDEVVARRALMKLLRGKVWTETQIVHHLATALREPTTRAWRLGVVRRMVREGVLFPHPPLSSSRPQRFALKPPQPESYIGKNLIRQMTALCRRLERVGVAPDRVFAVLREKIDPEGRPPRVEELAESLLKTAVELKPSAREGALVLLPDLWHAVRSSVADKSDFDRAVLHLAKLGRVDLHKHDHPTSLSPRDRTELVTDGLGSWFVGLALRS